MDTKEKNYTIDKIVVVASVVGVTLASLLKGSEWGKDIAHYLVNFTDNPEKMQTTADFLGTVVGAGIAGGASYVAIHSLSYRDKILQEKSESMESSTGKCRN